MVVVRTAPPEATRYHYHDTTSPSNPPRPKVSPPFQTSSHRTVVQGQTEGRGPTKAGVLAEGGFDELVVSWWWYVHHPPRRLDITTTIPRACSRPYPYFWPLPLLFCPYPYFFPILFTGPILKLFCSAVASSRVLPPFVDDAEREESLGK